MRQIKVLARGGPYDGAWLGVDDENRGDFWFNDPADPARKVSYVLAMPMTSGDHSRALRRVLGPVLIYEGLN
jgi:hypothetical protein